MDDQVTGAVKMGVGRVEDGVGGLTGEAKPQAAGKVKQAAGAARQVLGQAKSSVKDAVEDTLEGARGQVREQLGAVEAYVVSKPLPALAIAGAIGLVVGLLLRGRSTTVYLRAAR